MYENNTIITPKQLPQDIGSSTIKRISFMDDDQIPGAPYYESVWVLKDIPNGPGEHTHDFDEFLGCQGIDPDTDELGCTVEFWMGGEKYTFTKNFITYVPAGVPHCPLNFLNVTKPVINYSGGPNVKYLRTYEDGTKRID